VIAMRQVLVVEDDAAIRKLLTIHLQDIGCAVTEMDDGADALAAAVSDRSWALIILDLGLPRMDGLEICRRFRAAGGGAPVLMLSARGAEQDRVLGLEIGADDYLGKPFSVVELAARAKALLRRAERLSGPSAPPLMRCGDIQVDVSQRLAWRGELRLDLTAKEFDLLGHLIRHPGRVFSRADLLAAVWGACDNFEHTVNSHINRLRAKIEPDPARPCHIETVWGAGYRLRTPGA
jgi:DNA-binding response OmpR family regulator